MFSKNISIFLIASVAAIMLLSAVSPNQVFAHGGQVIEFDLPDNLGKRWITVIMGHNNEPTTSYEWGKASGNHPMELFITDTRTGLNLGTASLTVDKYFYKNDKAFEKATEDGFEPLQTDISVSAVHGDPGHYFARQILSESGIYGYHVTGTVNYFGVMDVPIDVKAVCRDAPNASAFNNPTWFGGFGCPADIDDGKFP